MKVLIFIKCVLMTKNLKRKHLEDIFSEEPLDLSLKKTIKTELDESTQNTTFQTEKFKYLCPTPKEDSKNMALLNIPLRCMPTYQFPIHKNKTSTFENSYDKSFGANFHSISLNGDYSTYQLVKWIFEDTPFVIRDVDIEKIKLWLEDKISLLNAKTNINVRQAFNFCRVTTNILYNISKFYNLAGDASDFSTENTESCILNLFEKSSKMKSFNPVDKQKNIFSELDMCVKLLLLRRTDFSFTENDFVWVFSKMENSHLLNENINDLILVFLNQIKKTESNINNTASIVFFIFSKLKSRSTLTKLINECREKKLLLLKALVLLRLVKKKHLGKNEVLMKQIDKVLNQIICRFYSLGPTRKLLLAENIKISLENLRNPAFKNTYSFANYGFLISIIDGRTIFSKHLIRHGENSDIENLNYLLSEKFAFGLFIKCCKVLNFTFETMVNLS